MGLVGLSKDGEGRCGSEVPPPPPRFLIVKALVGAFSVL